MMIFIFLIAQFNLYYQHTWSSQSYPYVWTDFDEDGHQDLVISYNWGDSMVIYKLPSNTKIAKYSASPYEKIGSITYFKNGRVFIHRYTFNSTTYTYTVKFFYYENYTNLVWTSSEITSYYYHLPYPVFSDVDNDGGIDFWFTYRNQDSTVTLAIYKSNITRVNEEYPNSEISIRSNFNSIKLFLNEPGNYIIEFFDISGRKTGEYFLKAKRGENTIIPPFVTDGLSFYHVRKGNRILLKNKAIFLQKQN